MLKLLIAISADCSACGGFISSRKSVASGALNHFFCLKLTSPAPGLKKTKTASAEKPLSACQDDRKIGVVVVIVVVVVVVIVGVVVSVVVAVYTPMYV